jgi:hypothetical protein
MGSLLFNITIVAEAEIPGRLSCNYCHKINITIVAEAEIPAWCSTD